MIDKWVECVVLKVFATLDKDSDKRVTPEELKLLSDEVCVMS